MKNYNFLKIFVLVILGNHGFSQNPTLVVDFNAGKPDAFNDYNFNSVEINSKLVFPIKNADYGDELGVLENGKLSLLKDLNTGASSSSPHEFIKINDQVFFSAYDAVNGASIWKTDGTASNTKVVYSFGSNLSLETPSGLIASKSGNLFFTFESKLYQMKDGNVKKIFDDITFGTTFVQNSNNYCTFKNEVAFLKKEYDNGYYHISIYNVEVDSVVLLAKSANTSSFFVDMFGINEVKNGLIFGIDASFDSQIKGTYIFDSNNKSVTKLIISNNDYCTRIIPAPNNQTLVAISGEGYFMTNGESGKEQSLFVTDNNVWPQGSTIPNGIYNNKMVFYATEGFWGNQYIVYTDGTTTGSKKLIKVDDFMSNIYMFGKYAIFANGISNGFNPILHYINLEDGSYKKYYEFKESSNLINSVLILGVQNNKLYFLSNLNASIGRELYSIDLNVGTASKDVVDNATSLIVNNNKFLLSSKDDQEFNAKIYSMDGKLVDQIKGQTNNEYHLKNMDLKGIFVLVCSTKDSILVQKIYLN